MAHPVQNVAGKPSTNYLLFINMKKIGGIRVREAGKGWKLSRNDFIQ